jgi:hypothetical protein
MRPLILGQHIGGRRVAVEPTGLGLGEDTIAARQQDRRANAVVLPELKSPSLSMASLAWGLYQERSHTRRGHPCQTP